MSLWKTLSKSVDVDSIYNNNGIIVYMYVEINPEEDHAKIYYEAYQHEGGLQHFLGTFNKRSDVELFVKLLEAQKTNV